MIPIVRDENEIREGQEWPPRTVVAIEAEGMGGQLRVEAGGESGERLRAAAPEVALATSRLLKVLTLCRKWLMAQASASGHWAF